MDHAHYDESDTAERYVTGRLSAEERAGFEAHFVDCPHCLDRIEAAQGLREGIARAAVREESRPLLFRMPRRSRPPAIALALAASVLMLLGASLGLSLWTARRAETALEAEHTAAAQAKKQLAEAEQRLGAAEAAAEQERQARSALEAQLAKERRPQLAVPVFALIATRGDEKETLQLPPAPQWIVVSLERESPLRFDHYRVTLLSSDGKQLWQGEPEPTSREQLALGLHSSLLPSGDYVVQLDGIGRGGALMRVARHAIRVVAAPPETTPNKR
jgi:hypothetical protein